MIYKITKGFYITPYLTRIFSVLILNLLHAKQAIVTVMKNRNNPKKQIEDDAN